VAVQDTAASLGPWADRSNCKADRVTPCSWLLALSTNVCLHTKDTLKIVDLSHVCTYIAECRTLWYYRETVDTCIVILNGNAVLPVSWYEDMASICYGNVSDYLPGCMVSRLRRRHN
jgi:hypothetical protein